MATSAIQPSAKDSFVTLQFPTTNYGTNVTIALHDHYLSPNRGILNFVIPSDISSASITSANLYLYYYGQDNLNPTGKQVDCYKITRDDWVEAQVTWNIYKTSNNWTAPGGDYVTSDPVGGSTTFPANAGAWMSWAITAIAKDAIDNVARSVNLIVKFTLENITDAGLRSFPYFHSNNYTTDTTLCPKLVIEYTAFQPFRNYYPHILAH